MKIFISYCTEDLNRFKIPEIVEKLEKYPKIEKIFFWDRDSNVSKSIIEYIEESIKKSDVIIVISSEKARYTESVTQEIEMAISLEKKIIPIFQDINEVRLNLRKERGIKYNQNRFNMFFKELYHILTGMELPVLTSEKIIPDSKSSVPLDTTQKKFNYFKQLVEHYLELNKYQDALINLQKVLKYSKELYDKKITLKISRQIEYVKNLIKESEQTHKEDIWHDVITLLDFMDEATQKEIYQLALNFPSKTERKEWLQTKIEEYSSRKAIYQGTQIFLKEKKFLNDLENLCGEVIPNLLTMNTYTFGFIADNGHITELGLNEKRLYTLPNSIGYLNSLQYLNIGNNHLTTLPESIGDLSSLFKLNLINNKLTSLPESIGNLKSLKILHLMNNQLTTLPESLGNLHSLKQLNLRNNSLIILSESISKLKSLQALWLRHNDLVELPDTIGTLQSLRTLELEQNHLTDLPNSLLNIPLNEISIKNNPLKKQGKKILRSLRKKYSSMKLSISNEPIY
ncbi:MAG: TIR domain-containing protein [Promethearchaeota archaeon]